ncbi:MAG: hypothetical protein AABX29_05435 [Nanoarchaeota archaeon]
MLEEMLEKGIGKTSKPLAKVGGGILDFIYGLTEIYHLPRFGRVMDNGERDQVNGYAGAAGSSLSILSTIVGGPLGLPLGLILYEYYGVDISVSKSIITGFGIILATNAVSGIYELNRNRKYNKKKSEKLEVNCE